MNSIIYEVWLLMLGSELRNFQFPVGSTAPYCPGNATQIPNKFSTKKLMKNCNLSVEYNLQINQEINIKGLHAPGAPLDPSVFIDAKTKERKSDFNQLYFPKSSISSIISSLGICFLVVGYTVLGALTFMALEGKTGIQTEVKTTEHDALRSQTVEKLWSITEDLNILYKDNWTRLAEQEVLKFQNLLVNKHKTVGEFNKNYNWSFPSAFLYSLTLITTIGYGNVTPRTAWGRLITIAYALIGIPLMLVYLSTVGDTLAQNFRHIYFKLTTTKDGKTKNKLNKNDSSILQSKSPLDNHISKKQHEIPFENPTRKRVPICLTLLVIVLYITGGAFLFNKLENWTFIEGSYFCFTSLGTIGFGELIPGTSGTNSGLSVLASSAFILVGMALVAMCFNLIQDETIVMVRRVSLWWHKNGKLEEEEIITVKSS